MEKIADKDTRIAALKGRIYPAIQNCVHNRYYILIGFFAFYVFLLSNQAFFIALTYPNNIYISIFFSIIAIFNLVNYAQNNTDEKTQEERPAPNNIFIAIWESPMELIFLIFMILVIWITPCLINKTFNLSKIETPYKAIYKLTSGDKEKLNRSIKEIVFKGNGETTLK